MPGRLVLAANKGYRSDTVTPVTRIAHAQKTKRDNEKGHSAEEAEIGWQKSSKEEGESRRQRRSGYEDAPASRRTGAARERE
jgi:hypothetical protein